MTEFERINQKRVAEILRLLGLIDKSRRSQREDLATWADLLAPVRKACAGADPASVPSITAGTVLREADGGPDPRWFPAFVRSLSPEGFHSLVCAVAVRAGDDLAEARDG